MQIRTAPGRYEYRATLTNPNQQWGSTAPPPNSAGGQVSSGVQIRTETALQLAAVWASTALISDSIATLPINQFLAEEQIRYVADKIKEFYGKRQ